jgi:alkylation response protein AidB-like acyl-CoA dehydrogenase
MYADFVHQWADTSLSIPLQQLCKKGVVRMLNIELDEDLRMVRDNFARFFDQESTAAHVRAAEPLGFDPMLLRKLGEIGALGLRAPEAAGGLSAGLMEAALLMEEAGKRLASIPLAETIVAIRVLAELCGDQEWLTAAMSGEKVVTLALHAVEAAASQIVPAGAVADAVLVLEGDKVWLMAQQPAGIARPNHGSQPMVLSVQRELVSSLRGEGRGRLTSGREDPPFRQGG